jgi:glyoxylase-like metal-dependent hydrolase (beta-lactamase superfamily II)
LQKFNDVVFIEGVGYDSNVCIFDDVIVDTGTGQNMDYILKSIKASGKSPDELSLIVNTHNHYDHVGGNHYLNLKIAMHHLDAPALGDETAILARMFGKPMERMNVDLKLEEGDKIGNFEVLLTPGHTPGSICLYDGETLISGDTVFSGGGFGRVDLGGSMEDMRNSLERLSKLDIKYLLPGHGLAVEDGSMHVKLAYDISLGSW